MKKQFLQLLAVFSVFTLLWVSTPAKAAEVADSQKSEAKIGFYDGSSESEDEETKIINTQQSIKSKSNDKKLPNTGSKNHLFLVVLGIVIILTIGLIINKKYMNEEESI